MLGSFLEADGKGLEIQISAVWFIVFLWCIPEISNYCQTVKSEVEV